MAVRRKPSPPNNQIEGDQHRVGTVALAAAQIEDREAVAIQGR
jgi:hypothetical protein